MINTNNIEKMIATLIMNDKDIKDICFQAIKASEVLTELQQVAIIGKIQSIFLSIRRNQNPEGTARKLVSEISQITNINWSDFGIDDSAIPAITPAERVMAVIVPILVNLSTNLAGVITDLSTMNSDFGNYIIPDIEPVEPVDPDPEIDPPA